MDNLERNMNELKEMKNTIWELRKACTSFNSEIDQEEERISEVEDQINEIKQETTIREKSAKRNEQSLQEIWDYVRRTNLRLIGVPECDEENKSKLENTLQEIMQENFPHLPRQANTQMQEIQIIFKKSNPKAHNRQIHQGWNEGKNAKGSQRERSGYPQWKAHQTHSGSLGRNPTSQKRVGTNIQHP